MWSEDLTDRQLAMVVASGHDPKDGNGFGVELRGAGWATARSLVRKGLGWIESDPGDQLPGLYFNDCHGVAVVQEFEPEPDYYDCGNCYGNGCYACDHRGRVESQRHREEREDYMDRKADAIRKGEW